MGMHPLPQARVVKQGQVLNVKGRVIPDPRGERPEALLPRFKWFAGKFIKEVNENAESVRSGFTQQPAKARESKAVKDRKQGRLRRRI